MQRYHIVIHETITTSPSDKSSSEEETLCVPAELTARILEELSLELPTCHQLSGDKKLEAAKAGLCTADAMA
ncbi:hypothetical protein J6590_033810 [Homalodisca vitripennis]|nr:hypothetical protein J6590_033810 [Homalodisca vitripennis]